MIDYEDQGVNSYLTPEEMAKYPVEEQQILIALRYLADNDDGASDKDHAGFNRNHAIPGRDLASQGRPWTAKQLLYAYNIAKFYMNKQLTPAGYMLPEESDVHAVARRKAMAYAARQQQYNAPESYDTGSKARVIGIKDGLLGIMFPDRSHDFQSNLSKIRAIQQEVEGLRLLNPTMPRVAFVDDKRDGKVFKYWQCPLKLAERVVNAFPNLKATPDVLCLINAEVERKAAEQRKIEEAQRAHRERVGKLLGALGDLDVPIGDRTLYAHQKEAVRTMLEWGSGVLAFDTGTGKTLIGSVIALAYKKAEDCRAIIVGPLTMRGAWVEEAGRIGVPIEYYAHDSIPEDFPGKYILIVDECDAYQNMRARRTQKFVELSMKAVAVFPMSGTPARNGRPSGIYPALLAVKNPHVYAELIDGTPADDQIKKLRKKYEARYCAAHATEHSAWDTTGAAYLEEFHKKFVGTPRGILRKLIDDCIDLPEKVRELVQVDLNVQEIRAFEAEITQMQKDHERRVAEKIEAFKEERLPQMLEEELKGWLRRRLDKKRIDNLEETLKLVPAAEVEEFKSRTTLLLLEEEQDRLKQADALVAMGQYRHAGSRAKARAAIEMIWNIFEEDAEAVLEAEREGREHKPAAVVVFCEFKDVAQQIADEFDVPVLSGDTPDKKRKPMIEAFQNGDTRVFVSIYGAGGVGITLHAAAHIILVGRPWTPGATFQAEARCIAEGQLVMTEKGLIPIEEIKIGDRVLTHTGKWQRVTATQRREHRGLMTRITYARYHEPLYSTHDHKIFVKKGDNQPEWIEAHKTLPGDFLVMPRPQTNEYLSTINLPSEARYKGTFANNWGVTQTNGRYKMLADQFELNNDLLWLFGWYLAEGWCSISNDRGTCIGLASHEDEMPILERIANYLEGIGVKATIHKKKNAKALELKAYSLELTLWLKQFFGTGSREKSLPPLLLGLSQDQSSTLLEAYVEGDGYKRKRQVEWKSFSRSLASQMLLLALKCGHSPTIRNNSDGAWVAGYTVNGIPDNKALSTADEHYVYHPVHKVETCYANRRPPTYVYDLTVEEDHSFVVGQAIVHNCRRIGQSRTVLCQWLQIPAHISHVDSKIDQILQKKQKNISTMLDGAKEGDDPNALEFTRKEALELFYEATHFKASNKEVEVEQ